MKKGFLLFLLLNTSMLAHAQDSTRVLPRSLFVKGALVAGLNVRGVYAGLKGIRTDYVPRLHYFVSNNWSIGPELRLDWTNRRDQFTGAGVSARYFFWKKSKVAVFGQAGLQYGERKYVLLETRTTPDGGFTTRDYSYRETIGRFNYGIGLNYSLGRNVGLEVLLEKNRRQLFLGSLIGGYQPGIGLNVKLN